MSSRLCGLLGYWLSFSLYTNLTFRLYAALFFSFFFVLFTFSSFHIKLFHSKLHISWAVCACCRSLLVKYDVLTPLTRSLIRPLVSVSSTHTHNPTTSTTVTFPPLVPNYTGTILAVKRTVG